MQMLTSPVLQIVDSWLRRGLMLVCGLLLVIVGLGGVLNHNVYAQSSKDEAYPVGTMRMTFRVFFAGLDVGKADADIHFVGDKRTYTKVGGTSGSAGVLRFFVRWEYDTETWGLIKNGKAIPSAHRGQLVFRDDTNVVRTIYKDGVLDEYAIKPPQDQALKQVTNPDYRKQILSQGGKSYHPNAEDVLTSLQRIILEVNRDDDCRLDFSNGVYVYDGPVSGEINNKRDITVKKSKYSPYFGAGFECLIFGAASWLNDKEYKQRIDAQIDSRKTTIEFLDVGPAHLPLLPVRVTYNTDVGGAIKVYLSEFAWVPGDDADMNSQQWQKTLSQLKNNKQ